MILRRTSKAFRRSSKTWENGNISNDRHHEVILRVTWWLLFIPIFSYETIQDSNM